MLKMKNSGYRQKFRKEVLDSGQKAFQKMLKDDKCGLKPMNRSADYNAKERQNFKSKRGKIGGTQRSQKYNTRMYAL